MRQGALESAQRAGEKRPLAGISMQCRDVCNRDGGETRVLEKPGESLGRVGEVSGRDDVALDGSRSEALERHPGRVWQERTRPQNRVGSVAREQDERTARTQDSPPLMECVRGRRRCSRTKFA
jgi:hypothetical protein